MKRIRCRAEPSVCLQPDAAVRQVTDHPFVEQKKQRIGQIRIAGMRRGDGNIHLRQGQVVGQVPEQTAVVRLMRLTKQLPDGAVVRLSVLKTAAIPAQQGRPRPSADDGDRPAVRVVPLCVQKQKRSPVPQACGQLFRRQIGAIRLRFQRHPAPPDSSGRESWPEGPVRIASSGLPDGIVRHRPEASGGVAP